MLTTPPYSLCIKDIYLFFLTIIIFYLLYCNICSKKEGFDTTADVKTAINQVYNADIEAIRNLSSIASQLITGGLTVPGDLNITNNLYVKSSDPGHQVQIGTSQIKFRGDGKAHYALTNDSTDGKFKISNSGGNGEIGKGFVNDCMTIDTTGNTTIAGTLTSGTIINENNANIKGDISIGGHATIAGKLRLPNNTTISSDPDDPTHWVRLVQTDNGGQYPGTHRETYRLINKDVVSALALVAEKETPPGKLRNMPTVSQIVDSWRSKDIKGDVLGDKRMNWWRFKDI